MESAIRVFLKDQGMRGNVALATLLDQLEVTNGEALGERIEAAMQKYSLSSSVRVDTLLTLLREARFEVEEGNGY